jgi:hypothetical protein
MPNLRRRSTAHNDTRPARPRIDALERRWFLSAAEVPLTAALADDQPAATSDVPAVLDAAAPAASQATPRVNVPTPRMTAQWWQWLYSYTVADNPALDTTGALSSAGDQGNVFFLAGSFDSTPVVRTVTIPAGEPIFFPLITAQTDEYWINPLYNPPTISNMRREIADAMATCYGMFATMTHAGQTSDVRVDHLTSPVFGISMPATNNLYQAFLGQNVTEVWPSVADGYYGFIRGLEPSTEPYVLHFGGTMGLYNFVQDITYQITVQAPDAASAAPTHAAFAGATRIQARFGDEPRAVVQAGLVFESKAM